MPRTISDSRRSHFKECSELGLARKYEHLSNDVFAREVLRPRCGLETGPLVCRRFACHLPHRAARDILGHHPLLRGCCPVSTRRGAASEGAEPTLLGQLLLMLLPPPPPPLLLLLLLLLGLLGTCAFTVGTHVHVMVVPARATDCRCPGSPAEHFSDRSFPQRAETIPAY